MQRFIWNVFIIMLFCLFNLNYFSCIKNLAARHIFTFLYRICDVINWRTIRYTTVAILSDDIIWRVVYCFFACFNFNNYFYWTFLINYFGKYLTPEIELNVFIFCFSSFPDPWNLTLNLKRFFNINLLNIHDLPLQLYFINN